MAEITFLIPVAPYHTDHVNRAVESVRNQTIPCDYIVFEDVNERGAGFARNRLLEKCKSPICSFLDADDEIEPQFAEYCFDVWQTVRQKKRYVYTNWTVDGEMRVPPSPCDLWTRPILEGKDQPTTFHLITTFLPTEYARAIGGFDETMPANEDADFAVRLKLAGYCGIHLNAPLVHYNRGGQRSISGVISGETETYVRDYFPSRYGQYERILTMGCCGDIPSVHASPQGEKQPGDILAQALWAGNRVERSYVQAGRLYPRASTPKQVWVNPGDVAMRPDLWRKVAEGEAPGNVIIQPRYQAQQAAPQPVPAWDKAADALFGGGKVAPVVQEAHQHYAPMVNKQTPQETVKKARGRVKRGG